MPKPNFEGGSFESPEDKDNLGQNWKNKKRKFIPLEQFPARAPDGEVLSPDKILMMEEEGKPTDAETEDAGEPDYRNYTPSDDEVGAHEKDRLDLDKKEGSGPEPSAKVENINPNKAEEFRTKESHHIKPKKFKGAETIRGNENYLL